MKKNIPFLIFWLLNSLFLYFATIMYPTNFVLGNVSFSTFWATLVAGLVWTGLVWYSKPFIMKFGLKIKGRGIMFVFYTAANFIAIWIIARLSAVTGFGISRFTWAISLAIVANTTQWLTWQALKSTGTVKK